MKKIEAYIQERKLDAVCLALHRLPTVGGATVARVHGFGRPGAGNDGPTELRPTVLVTVFAADDSADAIVDCIRRSAHTGLRGDGAIYVLPVDHAVRIATPPPNT
jgi:nitrogen regulatory protein P-II 1